MASTYIKLPVESGGGPGAGVDSFNGRTGVVVSQSGDYSAGIVSNTPAGDITATTVQAAINELDTEKQATITGAASTITTANLTASRAVISNVSGKITTTNVTHTELDYVHLVTSPIQAQLDAKQPLDADLTAIAALGTSGVYVKTGAGTAETRSVVAGSAAIDITNGDGVAGDISIDLPDSGVSAGTYGSETETVELVINEKGIVTSGAPTSILIPSTQVSDFTTAAQTASVQNALFPASSVKAPSVNSVVSALATVATNPMTAVGDLIRGGTAGAPTALPIGDEDDILRVVSGVPSWEPENLTQDFGDASDGNLTVSGALTLSQIAYYDTLTITAGAVLNTGGFPLYCRTLDLTNATTSGAIVRNGGQGGNATGGGAGGGAGIAVGGSILGGSQAGTAGAAGLTNAGGASATPSGASPSNGGAGGGSGASGAGGTGAGVAFGAGGTATNQVHFGRFEYQFLRGAQQIVGGAGGDGGNSGGGDGASPSRGGGGGGSGGGVIAIYAANIITSASTASNLIQALGGNGGNAAQATVGSVGGSSGGGGGGGGYVYLAYVKKTGPVVANLISCTGGTAGTSSNGNGTGLGANGSSGGNGGIIQTFDVTTGTGSQTIGSLGGVGTAAVGITAGAPGSGGSSVRSL
jgi:hypothetical protein